MIKKAINLNDKVEIPRCVLKALCKNILRLENELKVRHIFKSGEVDLEKDLVITPRIDKEDNCLTVDFYFNQDNVYVI